MATFSDDALNFSAMTGATLETANYYLEMGGGATETAVSLYFEMGGAPVPSSTNKTSTSEGSTKGEDGKEVEHHTDSTPTFTFTAPSSQFDLPEGRSACTTIACEAAYKMTGESEISKTTGEKSIICVSSSTFEDVSSIVNIIADGVTEYKVVNSNSSVEHMSCGEVMLMSQKYSKVMEQVLMVQGTTEGINAFEEELKNVLNGATEDNSPVCAVITKPPESVVVYCHQNGTFVLFDSHPRQTLGINGAYVCGFSSAKNCAAFLRGIFPAVSGLGDGMMAQMYNSFELTVLRRK
jgi:hypothetical protein